jgi:hypothetical protein
MSSEKKGFVMVISKAAVTPAEADKKVERGAPADWKLTGGESFRHNTRHDQNRRPRPNFASGTQISASDACVILAERKSVCAHGFLCVVKLWTRRIYTSAFAVLAKAGALLAAFPGIDSL